MPSKPDMEFAWGESSALLTEPSDTKKQTGWVVEKPPVEYMNWEQNRADVFLQHVNERGIPEWDILTTYVQGAFVWKNTKVYRSLTGSNLGNDPETDIVNWRRDAGDMLPPTSIINEFSTAPNSATMYFGLIKVVSAGALTAGVWANVFQVSSGSGVVHAMGVRTNLVSGVARTFDMRLTVDGVVVFNSTSAAAAAANIGMSVAGQIEQNASQLISAGNSFAFYGSVLLEVRPSINTSDIEVGLEYKLT